MKRSSMILKSGFTLLDQAVLSGTSFLISLILIKTVATEEYGYYSIAFAASLFIVAIQNAVVTTPLAVFFAAKSGEERRRYIASLYAGQLVSVIPLLILSLIVCAVVYMLQAEPMVLRIALSLCAAAAGILLREFSRAYCFASESLSAVLAMDVGYAVLYVSLVALAHLSIGVSVPVVFVSMGVSGFVASLLFSQGIRSLSMDGVRETYKEHWTLGKWSLTGVFITHVQSYCNLYFVGALLGSSAAGSLSASRIPLMPMALLQAGWSKVSVPRGSRLRESRQLRTFFKEQLLVSGAAVIGVIIYVGLLLMCRDPLKAILFNKGYERSLDYVAYWAAISIVSFAGLNASIGLQVVKGFDVIAKLTSLTMIVTIVLSYFLIGRYGITGGLTSSLVGETLLAIGLWWSLKRRYFDDANRPDLLRIFTRWPAIVRKGIAS